MSSLPRPMPRTPEDLADALLNQQVRIELGQVSVRAKEARNQDNGGAVASRRPDAVENTGQVQKNQLSGE